MVEAGARTATAPDGVVKHVCFFLQGQEFAADIADVKETMAVRPITRVFLTPPWLAGIINLRGDIVAVIDLSLFLGMAATVVTDETRIVIVQDRGDGADARATAGILVDRMAELRALDAAQLQPPPGGLDAAGGLLAGVATVEDGRPVRVLRMRDLFASDRLRAFRREES